MNLRQQIVHDNISTIAASQNVCQDDAFMLFAWSMITGRSVHSFDSADLVDGGEDKQIDTITIEEDYDSATIYIIQAKNRRSFSSNALIQLGNGLNWLFNKSRADIQTLANDAFKDKVFEYRSVQSGLGPSNIRVQVYFISYGVSSEISREFRQEEKTIRDRYDNQTFDAFTFETIGADELVSFLNTQERHTRKIDAEIRIRYDANNPSLIRYFSEEVKGLVCTAPASEIARIVNEDDTGAIFDLNVRRYLGSRGAVNSDIHNTCSRADSSLYFWFLNNGITIVCDSFDAVTDPDNPHIKITNMQIVNGCQTASTLAKASQSGELAADVRVLLRVYETTDLDLVDKIVLTTNNQNKISTRNLRANDPIQLDMERAFLAYNYYYERKPRQFYQEDIEIQRILPNEFVAQSYLAVVLRKPSDARGRKGKVWAEHYSRIFSGTPVEPFLISSLLTRKINNWLKDQELDTDEDDLRRSLAKKGGYHIARICAYLWRGNDEWRIDQQNLLQYLYQIEEESETLEPLYSDALTVLEEILSDNEHYIADIDRALKSYTLDADINSRLFQV